MPDYYLPGLHSISPLCSLMTLTGDALQSHVFCGKCGGRTVPIEAGGKRQCTADPAHREYPRTDPVVSPSPFY